MGASNVSGGTATTRVTTDIDAVAAARKAATRAAARKNLAAILCKRHGVDLTIGDPDGLFDAAQEFAELCDVLGLDAAEVGSNV
jgi:hypothetical protein